MRTYKPGVTGGVRCDFCDADHWCATRIAAGIIWACSVCGDVDDRHPVIPENDRLEEDL
jgi:ribosomal protein L37AE/L43A